MRPRSHHDHDWGRPRLRQGWRKATPSVESVSPPLGFHVESGDEFHHVAPGQIVDCPDSEEQAIDWRVILYTIVLAVCGFFGAILQFALCATVLSGRTSH